MERKILITSALPYVNNIPHLGNIIGCVLSADVFARYCRSSGKNVLYICGTDEYGTATEIKALDEGVTPQQICDKYYKIHKEIYEWFGIKFDYFGRTSTPKHTEITQDIFLKLYNNGHVIEEEIEQPYDEKAKMFLADRYIEGTCPFCGSENARADQCDKCGKLLTFQELITPVSKVSKTKPVIKKTKHLFIDLPGIEKKLEPWIEKTAKSGTWSENSYNIAKAWLREGLKKRAITRDLKWGVRVPLKGYEEKVFYVWFDAPIGYISITANYTENWKEWWLKPSEVNLYQFMGKDNVPFHTVIFPSTLMGTKEEWTLLHHINTTEFLNYEGGKFSKSRGVGVFGNDAVQSGVPADVWRYYLLVNRPENADTNFTWKDFGEKLNNELVANIGNLVNRTMVFTTNNFDGKIPEANPKLVSAEYYEEQKKFEEGQAKLIKEITEELEKVKIKDALHHMLNYSSNVNRYFQQNAPWKVIKEDKLKCGVVVNILLHQIKDLAILIEPYLPATSASIFKQLGIEVKRWNDLGKFTLVSGAKLGTPTVLFKKLEQKEIEALHEKYSGKQTVEPRFSDFDLEVGEIIEIQKHPNAEKLYVEKVKLSDGVRQIVSGLAKYYLPEQLLGKKVVIVRNLKPAVLRGTLSEGMLLAAENEKGLVEVLSPKNSKVGEKVVLSDEPSKPRKEITVDDFFKVKIEVEKGTVLCEGKILVTDSEELKTENVIDGKVG